MINANEIRIGNWVKSIEDDCFYQCTPEFIHDTVIENNWDDLQPIPLSPEILEKAGFELNHYDGCYYIYEDDNKVHFEFDVDSGEVWIGGLNSSSTMDHIKHLHQLQNLYFSLTNQELMMEEPLFITEESLKVGSEIANQIFAESDKEFRKDSK